MKKIVIREYPNRYWSVAEVFVFEDGTTLKAIEVNKFYDVDKDFITIYDTVGGSGTGYMPGKVLHKISIQDCELETQVIRAEKTVREIRQQSEKEDLEK